MYFLHLDAHGSPSDIVDDARFANNGEDGDLHRVGNEMGEDGGAHLRHNAKICPCQISPRIRHHRIPNVAAPVAS